MQENGLRLNPDKTEVLRVGVPTVGGLGNPLFWGGDPPCQGWGPQFGDPSGPGAHYRIPGGVRGPNCLFSSQADSPAAALP